MDEGGLFGSTPNGAANLPNLRQRKCLFESETPCLMIGSASWAHTVSQHTSDASLGREPADIDLIMTWNQFQQFHTEYADYIYQLVTTAIPLPPFWDVHQWYYPYNHVKYIARLLDGKVLEIEISDVFPSAQLLQQHSKTSGMMLRELEVTNSVPIQMHMCAVAPSTQLALKVSHATLPVHWRKTARDIGRMLEYLKPPLSVVQLLADPAACDPLVAAAAAAAAAAAGSASSVLSLQSLVQLRFAESVAVNYTLLGKTVPCVTHSSSDSLLLLTSFDEMKALLESIFGAEGSLLASIATPTPTASMSGSIAGALWTPLLPMMTVAADRFSALGAVDKRRLLIEVVLVVCVHYILRGNVMKDLYNSARPTEELAAEVYLLALEAVCTRCIPIPEPALENMVLDLSNPAQWKSNAEFRKWWQQVSVYDTPPANPRELGILVEHLSHAIPRPDSDADLSEPTTFEIPSPEQIASMGLAHPTQDLLCLELVSQMNHLLCVPPLMSSLVGTHLAPAACATQAQLSAGSEQTIPLEIWKIIVRDHLVDHLSALRLSSCSKELNKLITDDMKDLEVAQPFWIRLLRQSWWDSYRFDARFFRSSGTGPIEFFKRNWRAAWSQTQSREIYTCPHCGEYHHTMTMEAFRGSKQEHSWNQCPCPQCNDINGSWSGCQYHTVYIR